MDAMTDPVLPQAPVRIKWFYSVWFVLLMLTPFALGPFGLPLLWKSPRFSQPAKLWLTILTIGWTVAFTWFVITRVIPAVKNDFNQINDVFQTFQM